MDPDTSSNNAGQLLQWLDQQAEHSVMGSVMQQLSGAGIDAGTLHTAAATPVCLQVDVTALASCQAQLAMVLLGSSGDMELQTAALINQQLATVHAQILNPTADDLEAQEPPSVRVCLQMEQVPLPLCSVPEVMQQVLACNNPSHSSAASTPVCVSLLAVATGLSTPADICYSQRYQCPSCGQLTDVPATQPSLPCCNIPKTDWMKEDVTGRVMVQTQQLWVSGLSSAAGQHSYGTSRPAMRVELSEHLVGSCSLGQVVHIIGHAACSTSTAGPTTAGSIHVKANNLQLVLPHHTWTQATAASALLQRSLHSPQQQQQQPLQDMWELLTTALGYNTPLDPHLAVSMLLSAASVGGGSSSTSSVGPRQSEQVNLLVLHEAFSPCTPRLLREAAALLSPQSVSMPVQQAEHVTPITGGGSSRAEQQPKALYASILQLANTGIAAAELALMTSKSRTQLLQALLQRQTPTPKDIPQGLALQPLTATCWAAASWHEVCPTDASVVRPAGRRGGGGAVAGGDRAYNGFDLCIGDGTVFEDDLWGLLDIQASSAAEQYALQHSQQAAMHLRHLIGAAAGGSKPLLSDAAQDFLGQYFLMVRQSIDGSSSVSKPHLLASLVAVASASARLHQRTTVLECPDAALAVVLMEQSLANKLGDVYHSLLELPCDLNPSNDRSLDDQLQLLHGVISRTFRQSGLAGGGCGTDHDDEGCFSAGGGFAGFEGGEGSDASGCAGGVCGGDWPCDVEE